MVLINLKLNVRNNVTLNCMQEQGQREEWARRNLSASPQHCPEEGVVWVTVQFYALLGR